MDSRDDNGLRYEEYENCQFCGNEKIRFVHLLEHDEWPDIIRVGCVCAEKLTEDYVNPELRERKLRSLARKRESPTPNADCARSPRTRAKLGPSAPLFPASR